MQEAWVLTTTATQRQLVRLLDDKSKFIETDGGKVVLDLRPIIIDIGDQIVVIGKLAEKLPDSAGKIAIVDESQLETAQTLTKILRSVANWMWLLALLVAAVAVWLAKGVAGSSCGPSRSACCSSDCSCSPRAGPEVATSSTTSSNRTAPSRQCKTHGAS